MAAGAFDKRCAKAFGEISSIPTQFTGGSVPPKDAGTLIALNKF